MPEDLLPLLVPEHDPDHAQPYPGDIEPGLYSMSGLVALLRQHAENPDAIHFIADMLEE